MYLVAVCILSIIIYSYRIVATNKSDHGRHDPCPQKKRHRQTEGKRQIIELFRSKCIQHGKAGREETDGYHRLENNTKKQETVSCRHCDKCREHTSQQQDDSHHFIIPQMISQPSTKQRHTDGCKLRKQKEYCTICKTSIDD